MRAKLLDGKKISKTILEEVKNQIYKTGIIPGLAVILVGDDPASKIYVGLKEKACLKTGILSSVYKFSEQAKNEEILETIEWLNNDETIHAILVQLPLPKHLDKKRILNSINPKKDVDGFHEENIKKLIQGKAEIIPGLVMGIMQLLSETGEEIKNKNAVIIAKSNEFKDSMSWVLENFEIKSKKINPPIKDNNKEIEKMTESIKNSDIVITAVGKPNLIKGDFIKEGAIIIDVGITRISEKVIVGDIEKESCQKKASWISPVPGGVGPMTIAMLLKNTLALTYKNSSILNHLSK